MENHDLTKILQAILYNLSKLPQFERLWLMRKAAYIMALDVQQAFNSKRLKFCENTPLPNSLVFIYTATACMIYDSTRNEFAVLDKDMDLDFMVGGDSNPNFDKLWELLEDCSAEERNQISSIISALCMEKYDEKSMDEVMQSFDGKPHHFIFSVAADGKEQYYDAKYNAIRGSEYT